MKLLFTTLILTIFSSQLLAAKVISLDDIQEIAISMSEQNACFYNSQEFYDHPCISGMGDRFVDGILKIAKANLILKNGTALFLGESRQGRTAQTQTVDFKNPLSNLIGELTALQEKQNSIYFNQYNLCYKIGLSAELSTDKRAGFGVWHHLVTSRIYVKCDTQTEPSMVFIKD